MTNKKLFALSFIEGSALMIAELCGSKMIAPFFGTSIYVWASTLSITLIALAIGYFMGGWITKKTDNINKTLCSIVLLAGILICLMPRISHKIMLVTMDMSFFTGMIISQLAYMLIPILLLGMVSPIIISMITTTDQDAGKNSGLIYAISTIGGIVFTLLFGFYIITNYGIKTPIYITGAVLCIYSIFLFVDTKTKPNFKLLAVIFIFNFIFFNVEANESINEDKYKVLYANEGILGQIKVVDESFDNGYQLRYLFVNHNWMNAVEVEDLSRCFNSFVPIFKSFFNHCDSTEKILSIGLGGGFTANYLINRNIDVISVDIEPRMKDIATTYFGLDPNAKFIVDDGRHFVNKSQPQSYSTIIVNALLGDNIPSNLLSIESLKKMNEILTKEGKLIIDFDGIESKDEGMAQKSLLLTLREAGFHVKVYTTLENELNGELIYHATKVKENLSKADSLMVDIVTKSGIESKTLNHYDVTSRILAANQGEILTDDKPILDYALRHRSVYVRKSVLNIVNNKMVEYNIPIFN
jgi:predicted membrane-bound spermidine synthase